MGRRRKDELKVKKRISIRLKEEDLRLIKERGTYQEIIEKAVLEYLRKLEEREKNGE
jgi:predicted DNA binding CopG/RHH family protein